MKYLTRPELIKLSAICDSRIRDAEEILRNDGASGLEIACARREIECMERLSAKLMEIAQSPAKRIEVVF